MQILFNTKNNFDVFNYSNQIFVYGYLLVRQYSDTQKTVLIIHTHIIDDNYTD